MNGIPPFYAFLVGALIGIISYGPVRRWTATLRRAKVEQAQRPETLSADSRTLLLILATLHPAPWLFILGGPVVLYQLAFGSMRWMWTCLILGVALGAALAFLYETQRLRRSAS